jgi:hypothetical protein
MRKLAAIAVVASVLAFPTLASGATLWYVGDANDDSDTTIHFKAKGHYKKVKGKKVFVGDQVSSIRVYDQAFICYRADGSPTTLTGRHTYSGYALIDPLEVDKKGRFAGRNESKAGQYTTEYNRFHGKITNKKATGGYWTKASEGGIEFGWCGDNDWIDWTAKAQKERPDPPPTPSE